MVCRSQARLTSEEQVFNDYEETLQLVDTCSVLDRNLYSLMLVMVLYVD